MLLLLALLAAGCLCVALAAAAFLQQPSGTPGPGAPPGPGPGAPPVPPVPSWATLGEGGQYAESRRALIAANARLVAAATRPFDFVLWGDSITEFISRYPAAGWEQAFGPNAVHLGVGGNVVEQLAGRLMKGQEKPRQDPRVWAVLIGVNNVTRNWDPAPKMDVLLQWMAAAMPGSKGIVVALLPTNKADVRAANAAYRALAAKHGLAFADCGAGLDPNDPRLFVDGLHPTAAGYQRFFACLKPLVRRLQG